MNFMFGKLKEKLKSWTEKLAKKETSVEEPHEDISTPEIKEKEEEIIKLSKEIEENKEKLKETEEDYLIKEKIKDSLEPSEEIQTKREIEKKEKELSNLKINLEEKKEIIKKQEIISPKKIVVKDKKIEREENKSIFQKVKEKVTFAKVTITDDSFDIYSDDLEELLLENNVAFEVTEKILKELRKKLVGKELLRKEVESEIYDSFKEIINEILIDSFNITDKIKEKQKSNPSEPFIILFCGINGTGKTTSIAKIAEYLKKENVTSVLAAGDTFRAASIEQLQHHGDKIGIKVISHEYGHDPASVSYDAVAYAKKHAIDVVLIDTAGRMHSNKNLMNEIEKISRVVKPNLKIFVGESITGNDAIEQAKSFNWAIGIDGIILSKADIDEKGGTALSVGYVTKKPILFLGTGQDYGSIEVFDKEKFIERLGL